MIKRNCFNELVEQISRPEVSILTGPRQVGKTWLLNELSNVCASLGKKTLYFNLENPTDLMELSGSTSEIYNKLTKEPNSVIFIDEFHYLKNASKLFKAIYDAKKGIKIFASGSSSIELHKHIKESMAGRVIKNRIFPLSFTEMTQIKDFQEDDYLSYGGLPGLTHERTEQEKVRLIESIVETYLIKDIKSLIKEENIRAFNNLLFLLAQYQGSVVPAKNLSRELSLSEPTVSKYLEILSETYVTGVVSSFSRNLGNELKKSKKYYLYDMGVRNMLLKDFSPPEKRNDIGSTGEAFVFWNIYMQLQPNMEIRFWRTKQGDEVDFIVIKNRTPYPIEVKTTFDDKDIPKGMKKFLTAYPESKTAFIFAKSTQERTIKFNDTTINIKRWNTSGSLEFMKTIN